MFSNSPTGSRAARMALGFLLCTLLPATASSQIFSPAFPITNGTVKTIAVDNGTLYIGGEFDRIGQATGAFVGFDATGAPILPFAGVAGGAVLSLAPDGQGGWFIGGSFTTVHGQPRKYLAQLDAAGELTPWNPEPNNAVRALFLFGSTLYVGGDFTQIGFQNRSHLASIDVTTGTVTPWNPAPSASVTALAAFSTPTSNSRLCVGGSFTTIAGVTRTFLASFETDTGLLTSWAPYVIGAVQTIAVRAPRFGTPVIYAGGIFTSVDFQTRNRLAAFDGETGLLTPWNPGADAIVRTILVTASGPIYVGGEFTTAGLQSRRNLAAIDVSTGVATSWNPDPNQGVNSLVSYNGLIHAAGWFSTVGSAFRSGAAALDPATGLATSWDPSPVGSGQVLGANERGVFLGGSFTSTGGVTRNGVAALDIASGTLTAWNPDVRVGGRGGGVETVEVHGGLLYIGGGFDQVGGVTRRGLASVDLASGAVTSWNPDAGISRVLAIEIAGSTAYVGGSLSTVGGQPRSGLAAVNATTGAVSAWNPVFTCCTPDAGVYGVKDILVIDGTVYAAGDFTAVNGVPRWGLAALDPITGTPTPWDPKPQFGVFVDEEPGWVKTIERYGDRLILGGSFQAVGVSGPFAMAGEGLAVVDLSTGWATTLSFVVRTGTLALSEVRDIALCGNLLYVTGYFDRIGAGFSGPVLRPGLAVVDLSTESVTPWNVNWVAEPVAIACGGGGFFVGGEVFTVENVLRGGYAAFTATPTGVEVQVMPPPSASSLRASPNPFRNQTTISWASGGEPVEVEVFDTAGRRVRRISGREALSGKTSFVWDGRTDAGTQAVSGIYLLRVRSGGTQHTAKVLRVN